jgi:outer membrane protein assembly factor BamB
MKKPLLVLLTLLFISSCPLFMPEEKLNTKLVYPEIEPDYIPNIVWQTEVYYISSWAYPFEVGGYGYYPEEFRDSYDFNYCRLMKINLENGEIIWRTDSVHNNNTDQAQKIGDYIYLSLNKKDTIMVYNDIDGSLAATISLKSVPSSTLIGPIRHTAVYNEYIFWGNLWKSNSEPHGLMRFDTRKIDFNKNPKDIQIIEPELVWEINNQSDISTNIIVDKGIVYFLTARHNFETGTVKNSYLVSLDAETGNTLWVTERDFDRGDIEYSLLLKDNRLFVIDLHPSCYDINTGKPIFEKKDTIAYNLASPYLGGIFYYENKLYYTTQMFSQTAMYSPTLDPKLIKNIICIDGNTGDLVWGDLVPNGGTLFTFPLVYNGKAYVVTDRGLRVYNANTGVLIGVDKSVLNRGWNHNLLFNDMVIYPNRVIMTEYPRKSILTAIRAD